MSNYKTTNDFISDARRVHGDKYDYSLSEYIGGKCKLKIVCVKHGVFEQRPNDHLSGNGCKLCGKEKTLSARLELGKRNTLLKFRKVHGDRYIYDNLNYVSSRHRVNVKCKEHGYFKIFVGNHILGHGCPKCARISEKLTKTLTEKEFIEKAILKHGSKYIYTNCGYTLSRNKVSIACPQHGVFIQEAGSHLAGCGCPKCAKYGFDPLSPAFIYFLISDDGMYIKVGITNYIKRRIKQLNKFTPFSFSVIKYYNLDGETCKFLERYYHDRFQSASLTGFEGCTEWLIYSAELMNEIMGA